MPVFFGGPDEGFDVLGKAGASVAYPGVNKFVTNARIASDASTDLVHAGSHDIAEQGHIVHEANLGGQHGVGGVFGHFGRGNVHEKNGVAVQGEGLVEFGHGFLGLDALTAYHDAVRFEKILDRCAFFEKFGVGGHIKRDFSAPFVHGLPNGLLDFAAGAHRYGGFGHHHGVVLEIFTDFGGDAQNILEVGTPVFAGGCSDSDEDGFGPLDGFPQVGAELESAVMVIS